MAKSLVMLRDIELRDLDAIRAQRADPDLRESIMAAGPPETEAQHRAWFDGLAERRDCRVFAIANRRNEAIGTAGLYNIDDAHGSAEWGFFIGAADHRNDGSAVDAEKQILDYAFNERGLRRVWCRVLGRRQQVVSMHERFGFSVEGTLRRHRKTRHGYDDVVMMGIFADEYERSRPAIDRLVAQLAERAG